MTDDKRVYEDKNNQSWFGLALYNTLYDANLGISMRTANALGASYVATIGKKYEAQRTDVCKTPKCIPVFNYPDFSDFWEQIPLNCDVVGIELDDRSVHLENFVWPRRSLILMGSERDGLPKEEFKKCRYKVKLNTELSLNLSSMAGIVMYDRFVKLKNKNTY